MDTLAGSGDNQLSPAFFKTKFGDSDHWPSGAEAHFIQVCH